MERERRAGTNRPKTINCIDPEYRDKRFHYDGWRVENDGKSVVMKITVDDNTKGELLLPWEEIDKIRQFGWERQKDAAEEKMHGKQIYCRHLRSFNALFPECCQIGLSNGPKNVGCLDCQYIDGSIEDINSEARPEEIDLRDLEFIDKNLK